jgi:hypothetical protein
MTKCKIFMIKKPLYNKILKDWDKINKGTP